MVPSVTNPNPSGMGDAETYYYRGLVYLNQGKIAEALADFKKLLEIQPDHANADAGKKAFIMNRIGDFGLLVAMFMIFRATGSLNFVEVFEAAPATFALNGIPITIITLALFLGCVGKSAQIPLYTWLPDAMAGPTPVSALIHAATMVTAGVYLVARSNVLFTMAPLTLQW